MVSPGSDVKSAQTCVTHTLAARITHRVNGGHHDLEERQVCGWLVGPRQLRLPRHPAAGLGVNKVLKHGLGARVPDRVNTRQDSETESKGLQAHVSFYHVLLESLLSLREE